MTARWFIAMPLAVLLGMAASGAGAQSGPSPGVPWTLDTTAARPSRKGKAPAAGNATRSAAESKAAHDAELQRQFFDRQAAGATSKPAPAPFGGYDASKDMGDGSFKPGAAFKF